jgi:hypothetical protein
MKTVLDPRLRKAIIAAVRGEPSPWPIDKHHPENGTFQERFDAGDQQIMLWAIALAAENGERTPPWAADALMEKLLEVSIAAKDWDGVFDPPNSQRDGKATGANPDTIARRARYMFKCYDIVKERNENGEGLSDILFNRIGRELGISGSTVRNYYYDVKRWLVNFTPQSM